MMARLHRTAQIWMLLQFAADEVFRSTDLYMQVALMACSMTVSGFMLESLLEMSSEFVNEDQEAQFIGRCHNYCSKYISQTLPPLPNRFFVVPGAPPKTQRSAEFLNAFFYQYFEENMTSNKPFLDCLKQMSLMQQVQCVLSKSWHADVFTQACLKNPGEQ